MKKIYLVLETDNWNGFSDYPIYALTTRAKAEKYARELNKKQAEGVSLNDNYDFVGYLSGIDEDNERIHFFSVYSLDIDAKL